MCLQLVTVSAVFLRSDRSETDHLVNACTKYFFGSCVIATVVTHTGHKSLDFSTSCDNKMCVCVVKIQLRKSSLTGHSGTIHLTIISMHTIFELKRKVHSSKETFLHQYKIMLLAAQRLPVSPQEAG